MFYVFSGFLDDHDYFFTILSIVVRTFWWCLYKEVLNNHGEKPCNLTITMFIPTPWLYRKPEYNKLFCLKNNYEAKYGLITIKHLKKEGAGRYMREQGDGMREQGDRMREQGEDTPLSTPTSSKLSMSLDIIKYHFI